MPPPVAVDDSGPPRIRHGESLTRLLIDRAQTTPPGVARWALGLLAELAPLLDWRIVLAYARVPDPMTGATR